MSILDKISSAKGERLEQSNKKLAHDCLQDPSLLDEIAAGLQSDNSKVIADCAEVLTLVAANRPELVAPYLESLINQRLHPYTRARWEIAHSLALVAALCGDRIAAMIPDLMVTINHDSSIIVRDYTVDILANFSSISESAALQAFPSLVESLHAWNGRHAGHALAGLEYTARFLPGLQAEIRSIVQPFLANEKSVIRKAAKSITRITG